MRMGVVTVVVVVAWATLPAWGQQEATARLEARAPAAGAARYSIRLEASGELRPATAPGAARPEPVPMKVESLLEFTQRVLADGKTAGGTVAIRQVRQAAVAINGGGRRIAVQLRPEVATLVARVRDGRPLTYSPGGPLTRQELDIVQGPADPLVLDGLLPKRAVGVGDTWSVPDELARAISDYEALASNSLRAVLESLDAGEARIRLAGEVRGAARGGEGTMRCQGNVLFDRREGMIRKLELKRQETRGPGQVEAGFEFGGTLSVVAEPVTVPPELADTVIGALPTGYQPSLELLRFDPPGGAYVLYHDRDWHLLWDDTRLAVFKRLDHGELLAQLNLAIGPDAEPGKHQDPAQFREDIRQALGKRFTAELAKGELDDMTAGGFRYKVAVQGREQERDILWYYFLVASPRGKQVLATFTLNAADQQRFGDADLELVGSLQMQDGTADATTAPLPVP